MALVSFVIPCYRQAHFLRTAVQSVLEQSLQDVEAIVVDDGSPDDPLGVLGELAETSRVIYVRQENLGLPVARNTGVRHCRGTYLCFLDADDWVAPEFCERMVPLLANNETLAFVYCDMYHRGEGGPDPNPDYSVGRSRQTVEGNILPSLLLGGYFSPNTVLLRKCILEKVGLFDSELGGHADWDLWLRISAAGYPVTYLDEKLAYYRVHPESMSRDVEHMSNTRRATLRKLLRTVPDTAAAAIDDLCQSAAEQFRGNQYLSDQLATVKAEMAARSQRDSLEQRDARARIAWLTDTKSALEDRALSWQREAERLRDIQQRFDDYFRNAEGWAATLKDGALWHEQQSQHWEAETRRLLTLLEEQRDWIVQLTSGKEELEKQLKARTKGSAARKSK